MIFILTACSCGSDMEKSVNAMKAYIPDATAFLSDNADLMDSLLDIRKNLSKYRYTVYSDKIVVYDIAEDSGDSIGEIKSGDRGSEFLSDGDIATLQAIGESLFNYEYSVSSKNRTKNQFFHITVSEIRILFVEEGITSVYIHNYYSNYEKHSSYGERIDNNWVVMVNYMPKN
jgi:hypothetical protein